MNYTLLGRNALLYAFTTMVIRSASFLLIPVYTYFLSVEEYGLLSVLLQTAQILVIVVGMGSRTALVRFAKEYEQRAEIGQLIGTSVMINVAGGVAVTLGCIFFLAPLFQGILHTPDVTKYVLLTCAAATANSIAFHLMTYFRANQKGWKVTVAMIAGAAGLVATTAMMVGVLRWGVEGALIAQAVIYGLLACFLLADIGATVGLGISLRLTWKLLRFGLPLILVMGGGLMTQTASLYFLSHFSGLSAVGIYSLGFRIAAVAEMILILPFEMAYEPFVYGHASDPGLWKTISRLLTYLMTAFVFLAGGIAFMTRDILPLIAPPAFSGAYLVTFLLLPGFAFRGVYYIGESLLLLEQKTGVASTIVTGFSLFGVLLGYLLISRWGLFGAVSVYLFTTVATGATVLRKGLTLAPVRIERARLLILAALLLCFLTTVYSLRSESALVYYSVVPAFVCLAGAALFVSGFTRADERRVLQQFFGRWPRLRSVADV